MDNSTKYSQVFMATFGLSAEQLPGLKYQDVAAWDSVGHMGHPNGAVLTVIAIDESTRGTPGCVDGAWSLVYIEGSSYVFVECVGTDVARWNQFGPPQFCDNP